MFLYLKIQTLKLWILTKSLFIVEGIWHTLLQIINQLVVGLVCSMRQDSPESLIRD